MRGWLRMAYALAVGPARLGVSPAVVTLTGLVVTLVALPAAAAGGRWSVAAAAAVAVGGILDNVDGAVAVLTGRTSRRGALLDSVADRLGDAALFAVLVLLGAPAWLALTGLGASTLLEYVRARGASLGASDVGVVSVGERPSRLAVVGMFALACGVHPGRADDWALLGAAVIAVLSVVGLVQVAVAVRRQLD